MYIFNDFELITPQGPCKLTLTLKFKLFEINLPNLKNQFFLLIINIVFNC